MITASTLEGLLARHQGAALQVDSRAVRRGSIFIALPGELQDGRSYIPAALDAGAVLVLAEAEGLAAEWRQHARVQAVHGLAHRLKEAAELRREAFRGRVIAFTGSNGKSTSKSICATLRLVLNSPQSPR